MVGGLQPGDEVVAERIEQISRLSLSEAELLIESNRAKGAWLVVAGVMDLCDFAAVAQRVPKIVLESVQSILVKLALQMATDDDETHKKRLRQGIDAAIRSGFY